MKRFYGLLLTTFVIFGFTQFGFSQCSTGDITVSAGTGFTSGDGTAANPYTGAGTIEYCFTLGTFMEETLNWAHGITPNALPTGATAVAGPSSAAAQNTFQYDAAAVPPNLLQWSYDPDGANGLLLAGGPGWYVDNGDGLPGNNFGDSGNDDGGAAGIPSETYPHLTPFCFEVTIPDQGAGSTSWTPSVGVTGDGVTGSHIITPICTFFAVPDDEAVFFGTPPPPPACGAAGTFTVGSCVGCTGSGTEADPYQGGGTVDICFTLTNYYEDLLNWAHGVSLNTNSDNYTVPNNAAIPAQTYTGGVANAPADHEWIPVNAFVTGLALSNGPGWYVEEVGGDGDPSNNFGDDGDTAGSGVVGTADTYNGGAGVGPFCFTYTVPATGTGSFLSSVAISGDGQTGNHLTPTTCGTLLAVVADEADRFYWGQPRCGSAITGATACGDLEVISITPAPGSTGTGTDANPLVVPAVVEYCVVLESFNEQALNWVHSIFIRNGNELPEGNAGDASKIEVGSSGVQDTQGKRTADASGGTITNDGGTQWLFIDQNISDNPPIGNYATEVATVDGDGFIPYAGFYVGDGVDPTAPSTEPDPANNFGDQGEGQSSSVVIPGVTTSESFSNLEPFCFNVTIGMDTEQPGGKWTPNFGMSGDGGTGNHLIAELSCLAVNYSPTTCGPNDDGSIAYTTACTASFDVEVNSPAVAGTNAIASGSTSVTWDVTNCSGLGRAAVDADGTDLVADLYAYIGTGGGFDPIEAPAGQMLDLSCETESTNAAGGFVDINGDPGDASDVDCDLPTFGTQIGCKNPFLDILSSQFDIDCTSTPSFNIPAGIQNQTDCDAHTMTYFFPVYDFDRNAGANNTVPSTAFDYHPTCATPRSDVVILPVQPAAAVEANPDVCAPMGELISNNGAGPTGVDACATKAMTNICTPGENTSDWTVTWTAAEISTIYTGSAAYAAAYAPVTRTTTTACACALALASEFVAFDAFPRGEVNMLEWATASEENTKYHVIERSDNGKDFVEIGRQDAQGNSNVLVQYTFEDKTPLKKSYYRIRNIDIDGSTNTTNIKVVNRKNEFDLEVTRIYPVPTSKSVTIEFDAYKSENVNIIVMDIFGKVIAKDVVETSDANNAYQLDLSTYNDGVYMVALDNGTTRITKRIVKQ